MRGEQTVDNYEIGMKADWFDHALGPSVPTFQTDWQNMTGSTYVATIWWDLDGDPYEEPNRRCRARRIYSAWNTYEVNYFPKPVDVRTCSRRKPRASRSKPT